MRFRTGLSLAVAAALAVPPAALALDKSQSTIANPVAIAPGAPPDLAFTPIGGAWTNGVSKGKTKGDAKCKVFMLLKKIALPDSDQVPATGDEVICISDAKVNLAGVPLNVSSVFRGEVKSGVVKIKIDLAAEGIGCVPDKAGGPPFVSFQTRTTCYEPDPVFPPPPLPFLSDPTMGVYPAGYGPIPSSPIIAVDGQFTRP